MRGHSDLIDLRMKGAKFQSVTLIDFDFDVDWKKWGEQPRVTVNGDGVVDLDLRFVVGLTVYIESYDQDRADDLMQKCIDSGALIVASSTYPDPTQDPYNQVKIKSHLFFKHYQNIHDNNHHIRIG